MCDDDPDVYPSYPEKLGKQIQESNMQIVNPTTPSNYFHVLRRQVCREVRTKQMNAYSRLRREDRIVESGEEKAKDTQYINCSIPSIEN